MSLNSRLESNEEEEEVTSLCFPSAVPDRSNQAGFIMARLQLGSSFSDLKQDLKQRFTIHLRLNVFDDDPSLTRTVAWGLVTSVGL